MLRTILKGMCLLLLLVSMSGCLVGYDDGWDRRGDGYRDGHRGSSGGYDRGGSRDSGDRHDHDNRR